MDEASRATLVPRPPMCEPQGSLALAQALARRLGHREFRGSHCEPILMLASLRPVARDAILEP